ncbi:MAG: phage portal protein, partial [Alphaproteobacteria bacterium]|nr:phage portal protein [Alphaproteobacteria bacterium]
DRMRVIPGANGVAGYLYSVGGRQHRFGVTDLQGRSSILHLRAFHPLHDWYGLSPLEAAAKAVDQHNAASAWNQALLQNAGRPSGALVVSGDGRLSEDQFARLREEMSRQFEGPDNAGRPLLLEGGLTWQEIGLNAKELDWLAGKDLSAREIAQVYHVPPQLIGIPDAQTYSNNREARLALYEDAVLPLADLFCEALSGWVGPMFGNDLRLSYDKDRIEALSVRRDRLYERLSRADWLERDEKRRETGFEPGRREAYYD